MMMKYREEQFNLYQRDEHGCGRKLGDVITLSLTALNVILFDFNDIYTLIEYKYELILNKIGRN